MHKFLVIQKLSAAICFAAMLFATLVVLRCATCQVWQPLAPDLVIVTNTGDEGRRVEKLDPEDWMTSMTCTEDFCKFLCALPIFSMIVALAINQNKLLRYLHSFHERLL